MFATIKRVTATKKKLNKDCCFSTAKNKQTLKKCTSQNNLKQK
jgi:hypothetical protein